MCKNRAQTGGIDDDSNGRIYGTASAVDHTRCGERSGEGDKNTMEAYHRSAKEIAELKPDTIAVISPHTDIYADYFHVSPGKAASGDFRKFGAGHAAVKVKI